MVSNTNQNVTKELLLDWLRDAHAMEAAIVPVLEKQVKDFEGRPMIQQKVREHLEITKEQRDLVKGLVERLGGDTSTTKDFLGKMFTSLPGVVNSVSGDTIVKHAITDFAVENFEIASYKALIAAAQSVGQTEVVRVCQQILDQEVEMANWLSANLDHVVTEYVAKKQTTQR